jgi:hypothetical protein
VTYGLGLLPMIPQVLHILAHLSKERPTFAQARVLLLARDILSFEAKVGIDRQKQRVQKAAERSLETCRVSLMLAHAFSDGTLSQSTGRFIPG